MKVDFSQTSSVILPWGQEDVEPIWKHHVRGRDDGGMRYVKTSPIMHNGIKVGEYREIETLTYNKYVPEPFLDRRTEITIGDKTKVITNAECAEGMYGCGRRFYAESMIKKTPDFELIKSKCDGKFAVDRYKNLRTNFVFVEEVPHVYPLRLEGQYELLADVAMGEKVALPGLSKGKTKEILTRVFKKYLEKSVPMFLR